MIGFQRLFFTVATCDAAAEPWQLGFQDAATPMMQGIVDLHHDIFFFLILISIFVLWVLVRTLWHFHHKKNPIAQRITHRTTIEILRTIFPSIILMFIAIPSFALLYSMDEVVDPSIPIKAIAHQWDWTYEYSDYNSSDKKSATFDSYMIPEEDLELGQLRLLEVDNRVVITHLRILVTSADVLHSWSVPSSDVKCNAFGRGLTYFFCQSAECAGEDVGSTSSQLETALGLPNSSVEPVNLETALGLPNSAIAPECVRSHIKQELRYLFNIGRKKALSENRFGKFIEPLALNGSKMGFARLLLERIDALQVEHFNGGNHIPFKFGTRAEKERLYSILWEYMDN